MSDGFDFDDSFAVDESFLREVDTIAAAKVSVDSARPVGRPLALNGAAGNKGPVRSSSLAAVPNKPTWIGPQRSISSSSAAGPSRPAPPPIGQLQFHRQGQSAAGPSAVGRNKIVSPKDKGAEARRLALMDLDRSIAGSTTSGSRPLQSTLFPRSNSGNAGGLQSIPSSRLTRVPSGSTSFQTHLNFRKENQATKGKRWDRTAFAASGRRLVPRNEGAVAARGKGKGKAKATAGTKRARGWDDNEDEEEETDEEEDDWGGPLAPDPKSKVDASKPYEPPLHLPNPATINSYIYPTNRPKRDYQYEIVQACFTDNCLVALPTGLGKTFVAGVVMLNFYRWFPTGKIVFLAPTKPLVNQQIEACQMTCGIPSKDAAVMTGQSVSAKERAVMWDQRRVFYCTPQTLYNDLLNHRLDPRDIVLAVFDEAHKASGSYAYTTILAYLTAHHPYFRVLALTATPGADVPKVQGVVDALHISRIEIREAEDPAISKYMNEKRTEKHVVPMTDIIEGFRDRWAALMKPYVAKLVEKDILSERDLDIKRLKPFRLTAKRMEIGRDRTSGLRWALGTLQSLERMARAMTHLLEFSLGMFRTGLLEIAGNISPDTGNTSKKAGNKGNSNSLRSNYEFQKVLRDVEAEMNLIRIGSGGRGLSDGHPKMGKALELLLAHFTQAAEDEKVHGIKNDTRAMVFCSFRDCVLELVDMCNAHPDLLKATKFVGQSQGKQEKDKGFNQKEQKKTINDFKEGKFNILVSTSIGEEGLDIGEVDFVVIYDMPKQSIKLASRIPRQRLPLQRIGRTGRKRSGQVHVLMSENREDANWDSAQQTHREIQEEILHSRNLELFEDVERLLPPGKLPICEEMEMPVDPWDPGEPKRRIATSPKSKAAAGEKVKRGDEIPEGAHEGFKSVAELLREQSSKNGTTAGVKGKGRKRVPSPIRSESEGEEVEEDEELLYGPVSGVGGRKKVKKATGGKMAIGKGKLTKAGGAKVAAAKGKGQGLQKRKSLLEMLDEEEEGEDEEARVEVQEKVVPAKKKVLAKTAEYKRPIEGVDYRMPRARKDPTIWSEYKGPPLTDDEMDYEENQDDMDAMLFAATGPKGLSKAFRPSAQFSRPRQRRPLTPELTPPASPPVRATKRVRQAVATHQTISPATTDGSDPAPAPARSGAPTATAGTNPNGGRLADDIAKLAGFSFSQIDPVDLSWQESDDEDMEKGEKIAMPKVLTQEMPRSSPPAPSAAAGTIGGNEPAVTSQPGRRLGLGRSKIAPVHLGPTESKLAMPPPPLPINREAHGASSSPSVPPRPASVGTPVLDATQFPIRRPGARRLRVVMSSSEREDAVGVRAHEMSSPLVPTGAVPPASDSESSPGIAQQRAARIAKARERAKEFLDVDAELSGSASSDEGSSDEETESDRQFAGADFQPTQAPRGYNQRAMYMAGLSTQAGSKAGLGFGKRRDDNKFLAKARKPVMVTDSEGSEGSENEYELGSFVVQDDEDLGFDPTQSDLI